MTWHHRVAASTRCRRIAGEGQLLPPSPGCSRGERYDLFGWVSIKKTTLSGASSSCQAGGARAGVRVNRISGWRCRACRGAGQQVGCSCSVLATGGMIGQRGCVQTSMEIAADRW